MKILKPGLSVVAGGVLALALGLATAAFGQTPGAQVVLPAGKLFCVDQAAAVAIADAAQVDDHVQGVETRLQLAGGQCFQTARPIGLRLVGRVKTFTDWRGVPWDIWHADFTAKGLDVWVLTRIKGKST